MSSFQVFVGYFVLFVLALMSVSIWESTVLIPILQEAKGQDHGYRAVYEWAIVETTAALYMGSILVFPALLTLYFGEEVAKSTTSLCGVLPGISSIWAMVILSDWDNERMGEDYDQDFLDDVNYWLWFSVVRAIFGFINVLALCFWGCVVGENKGQEDF